MYHTIKQIENMKNLIKNISQKQINQIVIQLGYVLPIIGLFSIMYFLG